MRSPRWSTSAHFASAPYAKYCSPQARQTDQETREEEAEMSGWVSPLPPCTKSDPTWGAEGRAGRMGARLPTEWTVLCGGVDLRALTEALQMDGARSCWSEFWTHRELSCVSLCSLTLERTTEVIVSPVSLRVSLCNQTQTSAVHRSARSDFGPTVAPVRFA